MPFRPFPGALAPLAPSRAVPALALGLLCLLGGLAAPAEAYALDPARSHLVVVAPTLAPGSSGSAPLSGEMGEDGGFVLRAPVSAVQTGNMLHDAILRQFLHGTVTLQAPDMRVLSRFGHARRVRSLATLRLGGIAAQIPLYGRLVDQAGGRRLRTYFQLPLAPYGVRNPAGGSPGNVQVAIDAYFAGR